MSIEGSLDNVMRSVIFLSCFQSLILQETEKHIGNLERAISRLLNIEGKKRCLDFSEFLYINGL